MIEEFQNPETEPSIFILSLKAGGVGITLTKANHVFHFDRWWNPAVEEQASDRHEPNWSKKERQNREIWQEAAHNFFGLLSAKFQRNPN
jgi:hypothetical protein